MSDAAANDHNTPGAIPRDLPVAAFGGACPVMWGDE